MIAELKAIQDKLDLANQLLERMSALIEEAVGFEDKRRSQVDGVN